MNSGSPDRWGTYVQESGNRLEELFKDHFGSRDKSKRVCLVIGKGFDPRMLEGLQLLLRVLGSNETSIIALAFDEGSTSPSRRYDELVKSNVENLKKLVPENQIEERSITMFSTEGRRLTSRSAEAVFRSADEVKQFSDVIVDVSSLPRSVYFPVVAKLLFLVDGMNDGGRPNLFALVSESAALDGRIVEEGIDDDADYIHPFRGGIEREATASWPRVWFPLIGEGQHMQLTRIYDLINPAEICPLLPSPSVNPRRGDNLVVEYRELLFDKLRIEPKNFIYACETNPFEVYRQLRRAILHYADALKPLGGSNAVISANSSKLLSVGALLAAYELKRAGVDVAIAHTEAHGYTINDLADTSRLASESVIHGLWLSGDCYA